MRSQSRVVFIASLYLFGREGLIELQISALRSFTTPPKGGVASGLPPKSSF